MPRVKILGTITELKRPAIATALAALVEMTGRRRRGETTHLVPIGTAGPVRANLPALVAQAHAHTPVGCVLADAEFDSERNHTFVRQQLHALSIIPAKRGKKTWNIHGVRAQMRHDFPMAKILSSCVD